jgi:hypothetical protein
VIATPEQGTTGRSPPSEQRPSRQWTARVTIGVDGVPAHGPNPKARRRRTSIGGLQQSDELEYASAPELSTRADTEAGAALRLILHLPIANRRYRCTLAAAPPFESDRPHQCQLVRSGCSRRRPRSRGLCGIQAAKSSRRAARSPTRPSGREGQPRPYSGLRRAARRRPSRASATLP